MTPLILGLALGVLAIACVKLADGKSSIGRELLLFKYDSTLAICAFCLPALYILGSFAWWHAEATRYRFALRGVGFRDSPEAVQKITLGAEPGDADVVFSGLPAHAGGSTLIGDISWRPSAAADRGTTTAALELHSAPHNAVALLGRERGHLMRDTELELQIELAQDDLLRIDDQDWRVDLRHLAFLPANRAAAMAQPEPIKIPPRVFELPLVKWRIKAPAGFPQALGQRTYRLDRPAAGRDPARAAGRFASFIYRGASLFHRLYLVDLDPEVRVVRAGAVVRPPASLSLQPDDRVRIFALPSWDGRGLAADGLRERRSFRVATAEPGCLAILFDTPEVHTLSIGQLRRLDSGGDHPPSALRLLLTMGSSPLPVSGLHFREVSTRVAREALATLDLEPDAGRFQIAGARGVDENLVGRPFWIGEESAASLQIDRLSPPLALGVLLLAMALARAAAARAAHLSAYQLLIAMAVESLLALRLVLAYRAWALSPNKQAALDLALIAGVLIPWAFLAVSLPPLRERHADAPSRWLPAVAGCVFAAAWCWRVDTAASLLRRLVWLICLGAVAVWGAWRTGGLPPWRWVRRIGLRRRAMVTRWQAFTQRVRTHLSFLARIQAAARRTLAGLSRLRRFCPDWLVSFARWLRRGPRWFFQPWRGWVWLAFTGGRAALLAVGFKESINVGSRFSLTLLHVPSAVLCEAGYLCWLWRQLRIDPDRRGLSRFWTFSLGVWIVPAVLVSDNGLALVNWPIFLLALATVRAAAASRLRSVGWRRRLLRYGAAAALSIYLFSIGTPLVARLGLACGTFLPQSWQQSLVSERNYLRIVHFADPARLEEAAVRPSEDLATMSAVMKAYTAGPQAWWGHGYIRAEVSPQLRATALRDHLASVLIAGCWGLAGALGVIAIFGILCLLSGWLLPWNLLPDRGARDRAGSGRAEALIGAGGLAGLTLGLVSLYMLLTNYDLLPFTGRNVYLLGLDSTADVLESLALIVLLAIGASTARQRLMGER